jgi:hypothetical protein
MKAAVVFTTFLTGFLATFFPAAFFTFCFFGMCLSPWKIVGYGLGLPL